MDEKRSEIESQEHKESIDVPGSSGDIDGLVNLLPSKRAHSEKENTQKKIVAELCVCAVLVGAFRAPLASPLSVKGLLGHIPAQFKRLRDLYAR
jgi:hypothetical protein